MTKTLIRLIAAAVAVWSLTIGVAVADLISIDFNDTDGPHWTGIVDTTADTLTIQSWVENPGGFAFWTPSSLPLPAWPAIDASGAPFDVPDTFDGFMSGFAFVSPIQLTAISWNEGTLNSFFDEWWPGWGGSVIDGELGIANETIFGQIPRGTNVVQGVIGSVTATVILLGDVNLDGDVNLLDVDFFIDRLSTGTYQAEADCNEDGAVDLLDIDPFIAILAGT